MNETTADLLSPQSFPPPGEIPDEILYKFEVKEEKLLGNNVTLVGVAHHIDNFRRYEPRYKEIIANSDIVIMEVGLFEERWHGVLSEPSNPEGVAFFRALENLVRVYKKPYGVIDPATPIGDMMQGASTGLLQGWFIGQSVKAFSLIAKEIGRQTLGKFIDTGVRKQMTRFEFLKLSAGGGFALALDGPLMDILRNITNIGTDVATRTEYGIDDAMSLSLINYRNMRSGQALRRIASQVSGKRVTYIGGAVHPKVIFAYASHPESFEMMIKDPPYQLRDALGSEPGARVYNYDEMNQRWARDLKFQ